MKGNFFSDLTQLLVEQNIIFFIRYSNFLLDTMGATSKCHALFVVMLCGLYITVGLIFNVVTIAAIPSCVSQRMQHTIVEIVEEIKEKVPKWEMPALVWIIVFDLLIIISAMVPKMTFDQCKKLFEGMKHWYDIAFLASVTVSFYKFIQLFKNCVQDLICMEFMNQIICFY